MNKLTQNFWSKVDVKGPDDCWEWKAYKFSNRSGQFTTAQKYIGERLSSRVAWVLEHGPIPEGLCVLHKCDNRPCCNPRHLFLGTQLENVQDRVNKGRCVRGERSGRAKLTKDQILEILHSSEPRNLLAERYNVSYSRITKIKNRATWNHVL